MYIRMYAIHAEAGTSSRSRSRT